MIVAAALLLACLIPVSAADAAFKDVSGHWAEEYILQAGERSLVQGYNGLYRPDDTMTRAELVTVLWRASGEPEPKGTASFTDLTQDWYKKAVAWAEENAVVNGVAPGKFNPDGNVTREQVAAILFRLSGSTSGMELMFTSIYDDYYADDDKSVPTPNRQFTGAFTTTSIAERHLLQRARLWHPKPMPPVVRSRR